MAPASRDPRAAPLLIAVALLTVGLATAVLTAASPAAAAGHGDAPGQQPSNQTGEERNRSDGGQAGEDEGRNGTQHQSRRDDGRGQAPDDRRRAPPVEIVDHPGGFATRASEGSPRPTVAVDAAQTRLEVRHPDAQPLDLRLDSLIAYVDEDGDGAYDLGEPVEARTDLRKAAHNVTPGAQPSERRVTYQLAEGGELVLVFHLGTDHAPTVATKFDVVVRNHTFEREDVRIALGAQVDAPGGTAAVDLDGTPAVAGQQGERTGYLSWASTVQVDGQTHPVHASTHVSTSAEDANAIVYWSYPQGQEIVHDPTLGITSVVEDLAGQLTPFALGLLATLAFLGAGFVVRRRWYL